MVKVGNRIVVVVAVVCAVKFSRDRLRGILNYCKLVGIVLAFGDVILRMDREQTLFFHAHL